MDVREPGEYLKMRCDSELEGARVCKSDWKIDEVETCERVGCGRCGR